MQPISVLVSLITEENDFQREQAAAAKAVANRLGVKVQIVYAANDAVLQSQQLFLAIQSAGQRPDGILVEPVGTGMTQAAGAAVAAGVAWGVVNREVDYIQRLRFSGSVPVFSVATDHTEVGRIQGAQLAALLKGGGDVLCIEGPSSGDVPRLRSAGMLSALPTNIKVKVLRGHWTEKSGHHAIKAWLALSTSRQSNIRAVSAQNDAMAMGARHAFEELSDSIVRREWLSLPFLGCDGVAQSGLEWVRRGSLRATVATPPPMGLAMEILIEALRSGAQPLELTLSQPTSFPAIEQLKAHASAQAAR